MADSLEQPLHSDSCDIVGLLCLRAAKQGGESILASSANIYNVLQDEQPEALKATAERVSLRSVWRNTREQKAMVRAAGV